MKINLQKPLLRITRGKTKFPFRKIDSERFLIGAGNNCQLQLSADDIPMVFAIVHQVPEGYQIEAIHNQPPMYVNGTQEQFAILKPGDHLKLGGYEFEFLIDQASHVLRTTVDSKPTETNSTSEKEMELQTIIPPVPNKIDELTASELVARIEKELELIDLLGDEETPDQAENRKIA